MNGRLDSFLTSLDGSIEDLEIVSHAVISKEITHRWTPYDLQRLRRVTRRLDEIGSRIENKIERGPMPTGTGVSGA